MGRHYEQKQPLSVSGKKNYCLYLEHRIQTIGNVLAKRRGISFSFYICQLIKEDYHRSKQKDVSQVILEKLEDIKENLTSSL